MHLSPPPPSKAYSPEHYFISTSPLYVSFQTFFPHLQHSYSCSLTFLLLSLSFHISKILKRSKVMSHFLSLQGGEEDDTLCTDLTKKSTVYVEIFFLFLFNLYFINTALHESSSFSEKKEQSRAKAGERSTNNDTNYNIFPVQFRALGTLMQLKDSHVKKKKCLICINFKQNKLPLDVHMCKSH